MPPAERLERLRKLVQADVDALPDRPITLQSDPVFSSDSDGGVALDSPLPIGKQNSANDTDQNRASLEFVTQNVTNLHVAQVREAASSPNPHESSHRTAANLPAADPLLATNLRSGDLTHPNHRYTSIQALAKYPYKFCDKNHMQDIASAFFDAGKFWNRQWDLYYVWDIGLGKPLILVHEDQVHTLLKEINSHLNLDLTITDRQRQLGLLSSFPNHPRCLPRYLGRSQSREEHDEMVNNTPNATHCAPGEKPCPELEMPTLEEFKKLMEEMWDMQKAKGKAAKAKKQQDRLGKQKSMVDQFKRAQRYLGLRPSTLPATTPQGPLQTIDVDSPAPYEFDQSVVFVCVDVESYERAHHLITEVGVATLDTRDLAGLAPGPDGAKWRDKIQARHFRIKEHKHLKNGEFVSDNSEHFLFGNSTFIPLKDAARHVAACFQAPFGAQPSSNSVEDLAQLMQPSNPEEVRSLIFLGHDTFGDIKYLQNLGYDPMLVDNIIEALDTAVMYRVWCREQQTTKLGRILADFDINGWKLHNAGNDAVYTMQAMLGICVREASIRGSPEMSDMREKQKTARITTAFEDARQRVFDDAEGWSDNDAEGDGGAPLPLGLSTPKKMDTVPRRSSTLPQYDGPADNTMYSQGRQMHGNGNVRGGSTRDRNGNDFYRGRGGHRGTGRQADGRGGSRGRAGGTGPSRGRGRGQAAASSSRQPKDAAQAEDGIKFNW